MLLVYVPQKKKKIGGGAMVKTKSLLVYDSITKCWDCTQSDLSVFYQIGYKMSESESFLKSIYPSHSVWFTFLEFWFEIL